MQLYLETMLPFIGVLIVGGIVVGFVGAWAIARCRLYLAQAQDIKHRDAAYVKAATKNIDAVTVMIAEMTTYPHRYEDMPEGIKEELFMAREAAKNLDNRKWLGSV